MYSTHTDVCPVTERSDALYSTFSRSSVHALYDALRRREMRSSNRTSQVRFRRGFCSRRCRQRRSANQFEDDRIHSGEDRSVIQAKEDTLQAAIDIATDKLERILSDGAARKLASRRSNDGQQDYTEEFGESDYLTEGEEEVLRQMGALDEVLDI